MDVIAIVFNRGAGGNFLARIFTLDPVTVCLGGQDIDSLMNINYYPTLALDIYQSWKKTWKHQ